MTALIAGRVRRRGQRPGLTWTAGGEPEPKKVRKKVNIEDVYKKREATK